MNQEQLAEQLHVTRQAVSNWETGKTQPDIETLTKIAEYFDVSVEYLIYGKEPQANAGEEVHRWVWRRGRFISPSTGILSVLPHSELCWR